MSNYLQRVKIHALLFIKNTSAAFPQVTSLTPRTLPIKEQIFFAKRLSFLLASSIPLIESLSILKEQSTKKSLVHLLDTLITEVANGRQLSKSLERVRPTLESFGIYIIEAGELAGTLPQNLSHLAYELEKKHALRKKITQALLYPLIVGTGTISIVGMLTIVIFPKIIPIFKSMRVDLPWTTELLIEVSTFLHAYGVILIVFIAIGITIFIYAKKHYALIRHYSDACVLSMPVVGTMVAAYNLANFFRTLGLLLESGIVLTHALSIAQRATENSRYAEAYRRTHDTVLTGKNLSSSLGKYPKLFPPLATSLLCIGERTGNLPTTLFYLSQFYETELDDRSRQITSTIEPILMIMMGIAVGFIAVSIISPIYAITGNLHR